MGLFIVLASVIGGFLPGAGGHLAVLFQPFEFVIIFGAAIGAFIISNPLPVVIGTAQSVGALLKGSKLSKQSYVELLSLLYATFKVAKIKGDLALESHVEIRAKNALSLFQAYPGFVKSHEAVEFFCERLGR